MSSEVRADLRPALTLVGRFPDVLRSDIQDVRIGGRDHNRKSPLEALLDISRRGPHRIVRVWVDRAFLARAPIEAGNQAAVASGVVDIRTARIARNVSAFAASDGVKHLIGAAAGASGTG